MINNMNSVPIIGRFFKDKLWDNSFLCPLWKGYDLCLSNTIKALV